MDSFTQAALGAVVGERLLGRQLGRSALGWGALVGTLPDLDVLANPWLDTIGELYWHRGFSHSVFGVLLGTPLIGWLLFRLWNRRSALDRRNGEAISWQRVFAFTFLNFATHILIDCFTVYGTQLLDPWSRRRFGLNNFFIIDPLFTLPMFVWIAAALFRRKSPGRASPGWVLGCAIALVAYVGFSFAAQSLAARRFDRELAGVGIEPIRGEVSAAPFTTLIWRGLFETEDAFWITYWAVTDSAEPLAFHRVPKRLDLLEPHRGDRAIDCALWFSEEYLLVEPDRERGGFLATDLRFVEFWPEESGGMPRTFFTWHVAPAPEGGTSVFEPVRGGGREIGGMFEKLADRLGGDRGALGPAAVPGDQPPTR